MGDGCWVLGGYLTVLLMSFANKPETWNLKLETWNLKPETWNLKQKPPVSVWAQKKEDDMNHSRRPPENN